MDTHAFATWPPLFPAVTQTRGTAQVHQQKYLSHCATAFAELCRYGTAELDADNAEIASCFHSHREPSISLQDYLRRVEAEVHCGEDAFYVALILIGRACNDRRSSLVLLPSVLTAHRLFLTALRVATKMYHDIYRSNRAFAMIGGITNPRLNELEWLFLARIGFNATVRPQEVERVKDAVYFAADRSSSTTLARLLAHSIGLDVTAVLKGLPSSKEVAGGGGRAAARALRAQCGTTAPTGGAPPVVASPNSSLRLTALEVPAVAAFLKLRRLRPPLQAEGQSVNTPWHF